MKKDLKEKIRSAYENETPDLRASVLAACERETQLPALADEKNSRTQPVFFRRLVAVASCVIVFGVGLLIGRFIPLPVVSPTAETQVYIDVNPSLELSLDGENTVLSCTAANEDAEAVLSGMELSGVGLKTALNAIVGAMYVQGYLTAEDNSMLVSVDANGVEDTNGLLSYITNEVNEVFAQSEMECAIIAQGVRADDELKQRAKDEGVSVGKLHLVDKMVGSMDDLTDEDVSELARLSIKDLNLMYSAKPDDGEKPKDEVISGTVGGYIEGNVALEAVLTKLNKTLDDVAEYRVFALPSKHGEKKVVYLVTLRFKNDTASYRYEVDCRTGEVLQGGAEGNAPHPEEDEREDDFEDFKP